MWFVDCVRCKRSIIGFDAKGELDGTYRCDPRKDSVLAKCTEALLARSPDGTFQVPGNEGMFFVDCVKCKQEIIGFEAKKNDIGEWECFGNEVIMAECRRAQASPPPVQPHHDFTIEVDTWPGVIGGHVRPISEVKSVLGIQHNTPGGTSIRTAKKEIVGFDRPEDGSQDRYIQRKTKVPWASHLVWWWIHNLVAHTLIGIAPVRPFFQFHDWTSRKMHGVK